MHLFNFHDFPVRVCNFVLFPFLIIFHFSSENYQAAFETWIRLQITIRIFYATFIFMKLFMHLLNLTIVQFGAYILLFLFPNSVILSFSSEK